ncbi:MAG: response regulator transcription factor [Lachnospiraceae bacterium]|jgi:DNA-binding response OmpR family regulator|nr:response regulator transcription factor [Lachnospiraceae bacterium]
MGAKILVVDDEELIVKGIKFNLTQDKMEVDCAYDGQQAIEMAKEKKYDCVLLDVMLPVFSGYEVCQRIREFSNMPIIMLTAKSEDSDKILGLEYGADDYITKPFNIMEVKARIKAVMRRNSLNENAAPKNNDIFVFGDLKLDHKNRMVNIAGKLINLTSKEFDILELLLTHPNTVYSREELLKLIWGEDFPGDVRTVDVHVRRLREKVETDPGEPKYVYTKWGAGYYFHD